MPTSDPPDEQAPAAPAGRRLERPREGRWLAGVCAGLARYSGRRVGVVRLAFVLTIPFFGLPLVAYLAWWLILPEEGGRERPRGSALLSAVASIFLTFGGALALLTLAAASVVASVFGLGWGVVVVATCVLAMGLTWMREVNPGWTLLPLAALVLPAAVITGLDAHLDRQIGDISVAPGNRTEIASGGYQIGIGRLLVDLRHYDWAGGAPRPLKISGGAGNTVIALPHNRCVAVRVHYDTHDGLLGGAVHALSLDGGDPSGLRVFSREFGNGHGLIAPRVEGDVPVLTVDYTSQGGELHVRDYPNSVNPQEVPDWPGTLFVRIGPHRSRAIARREHRLNLKIQRRLAGPCANREGR